MSGGYELRSMVTVDADVELRVHGVHGTPPETMLGDPFPRQVAGDEDARFFRTDPSRSPTRSRYVREAFVWSRFTSGSPTRAFWLLFLPFTLVNLSRYTILSWDDRWEGDRWEAAEPSPRVWLGGVDAVLRLLGLAMTLGLLTTTVYVSAELVAHRCILTVGCASEPGHWLAFAGGWGTGPALLLALIAPLGVLGVVAVMGRRSNVLGRPRNLRWMPNRRFGDPDFWHEAAEVDALRSVHLASCCAVLGLLYSGFYAGAADQGPARWLMGAGGLILFATVVLTAWGTKLAGQTGTVAAAIGGLYTLVSCTWAVVGLWASTSFTVGKGEASTAPALPGLEVANEILILVSGGLLVYLFALAGLLKHRFDRLDAGSGRPDAFRPLARGWAMPLLAAVGVGLMYGLTTGVAYRLADLVGTPGLEGSRDEPDPGEVLVPVSASYATGASITVAVAAAVVLLAVPVVGRILQRRWVRSAYLATLIVSGLSVALWMWLGYWAGLPVAVVALGLLVTTFALLARTGSELDTEVTADYRPIPPGTAVPAGLTAPKDLTPTGDDRTRAVASAWRQGQAKYRYWYGLVLLGAVSTVGLLAVAATVVPRLAVARDQPPHALRTMLSSLADPGAWIVTALLAGLLFVGVRTFQSPTMRTATGIAWDLLSFWPRIVHPLCPPPYGGRAVLELADRVRTIRDSPGSTVVLSAHSQGSVLCFGTLMSLFVHDRPKAADPGLRNVGLVTYGSQLQWAYARLFPCFMGFLHLEVVHRAIGERWRSMYRETDPLGGPVLTWHDRRPESAPDSVREGCHGLNGAETGLVKETGMVRHGHDVRLLDPVEFLRRRDRPLEPIRGHGDYYGVPAFEHVVDDVVALIHRQDG